MQYKGPDLTLDTLLLLLTYPDFYLALGLVLANLSLLLFLRPLLVPGFNYPTIPLFFLLAYFCLMVVPSIFHFAYFSNANIDDEWVLYEFLMGVQGFPLLFLSGVLVANKFFKKPNEIIQNFYNRPLSRLEINLALSKLAFWIGLFIGLAFFVFMILENQNLPILVALGLTNTPATEEVRFLIYKYSDLTIFTYALITRAVIPITIIVPLFLWKVAGLKTWKMIFFFSLVFGTFFSLISLEKQAILSTFVILIVALIFLNKGKLSFAHLLLFIILVTMGGFTAITQYGGDLSISNVLYRGYYFLAMRVFLDPSYMTFAIYEMVSDSNQLLLGSTIRFITLFGLPYERLTAIGFLADLWVNFGWAGIIWGGFLMGLVMQFIQLLFFRERDFINLTVLISLMLNAAWLIYSNIFPAMVVATYVFGLTILLSAEAVRRVGKSRSLEVKT
ncbi:MAG: hypothetical protein ACE5EK_00080 [Nitrospinales bacterium]